MEIIRYVSWSMINSLKNYYLTLTELVSQGNESSDNYTTLGDCVKDIPIKIIIPDIKDESRGK